MAIKTFPNVSPDTGAQWGLMANTTSFSSSLNQASQDQRLPGDQWFGSYSFSNRTTRAVRVFLASLGGTSGRFYLTPPDLDQQGTMGGSGLVNGASQTGEELITDGWTASQSSLFTVGDYIEVYGELKQITEDTFSDGSGNATLRFTPPLRRSPPDNTAVITTNPKAVFKRTDNKQQWDVEVFNVSSVGFSFEEHITSAS